MYYREKGHYKTGTSGIRLPVALGSEVKEYINICYLDNIMADLTPSARYTKKCIG